jgi:hypothetical protein
LFLNLTKIQLKNENGKQGVIKVVVWKRKYPEIYILRRKHECAKLIKLLQPNGDFDRNRNGCPKIHLWTAISVLI